MHDTRLIAPYSNAAATIKVDKRSQKRPGIGISRCGWAGAPTNSGLEREHCTPVRKLPGGCALS